MKLKLLFFKRFGSGEIKGFIFIDHCNRNYNRLKREQSRNFIFHTKVGFLFFQTPIRGGSKFPSWNGNCEKPFANFFTIYLHVTSAIVQKA